MATNPIYHNRTKHVELGCHLVQDLVKNQAIATKHMCPKLQVADKLTKILPKDQFICLKHKLVFMIPTLSWKEGIKMCSLVMLCDYVFFTIRMIFYSSFYQSLVYELYIYFVQSHLEERDFTLQLHAFFLVSPLNFIRYTQIARLQSFM